MARLFLRFIPTEQTSLLGLGGSTDFLGQPERGSSSAALRDQGKVELRIHTTGSIRQDDQIRSEKSWRVGIDSDTALPSKSTDVIQAKRLRQICKSL